jgi:hypothetical protein
MDTPWSDLDVALNESRWLDMDVDAGRRSATATFEVLTLPPEGQPPSDARLILVFEPVGRIAASLTHIDDPKEGRRVVELDLADLSQTVRSFGGCPVYGWDFFDRTDDDFEKWSSRLSLDLVWPPGGQNHSIQLFQEGIETNALVLNPDNAGRNLDLRLWFDGVQAFTPSGDQISLGDVAAGGGRWWTAMRAGDPRTSGLVQGGTSWIVPGRADDERADS